MNPETRRVNISRCDVLRTGERQRLSPDLCHIKPMISVTSLTISCDLDSACWEYVR